jgi:hypothetical protein
LSNTSTFRMTDFGYFDAVVACLFLICIYLISWLYIATPNRNLAQKESVARLYHDPPTCLNIVACRGVNDVTNPDMLRAVEARALPNQRLALAFGIDNAFTTSDDGYSKEFRAVAARKLKAIDDEKWRDIAKMAEWIVHEKAHVSFEAGKKVRLVPLIQSLSLKISLNVLFQKDPLAPNDDMVSSLAWVINALWIESKLLHPDKKRMVSLQRNLRDALVSLFPTDSLKPRDTPMNLIIPAYETLWRVVLQCFVEVAFRHPSSEAAWRAVLAAYVAKPTAAQFSLQHSPSPGETASISAQFLAMEALRLYPPTRRIYRTLRLSSSPALVEVAADIERLHRDSTIWGEDSRMYVPGRWTSPSKVAIQAYIPFGGRTMLCPASGGFGPRMIAILVGALVGCLGTGDWKLELEERKGVVEGDVEGGAKPEQEQGRRHQDGEGIPTSKLDLELAQIADTTQPLDSSREAHASLYLRRIQ